MAKSQKNKKEKTVTAPKSGIGPDVKAVTVHAEFQELSKGERIQVLDVLISWAHATRDNLLNSQ